MYHRFPRPEPVSLFAAGRIPGGRRIPSAPGGGLPVPRAFGLLAMSTRALVRHRAGTTQLLQLHCIPCQANLPILAPQVGLGQDNRPDNGASPEYCPFGSSAPAAGNRLELIHFMGCKKIWAQSTLECARALLRFSCS